MFSFIYLYFVNPKYWRTCLPKKAKDNSLSGKGPPSVKAPP